MTIGFGIIGLGTIAARFAGVLNTMPEMKLVAVASRDKAKAETFGEKFGAQKAYNSYLQLIEDDEVDVVYVSLTHNFHYEIVKLCLSNNKAVLCEKPFVTNKRDAQELIELSKKNNVLLMEAMWTRCIPTFRKAREWVAKGSIGSVKLVNASFCFNIPFDKEHRLFNTKLAGGSLYDAGVYPIEFTTGILDENPIDVTGVSTLCETGVDDFMAMSMKFQSGALATLSCGLTSNTSQDAYVYGTEGHVVVYGFLGSKKCELYDKNGGLVERFEVEFEDGFVYQIEHFANLYKNHKIESDLIPLRDTLACAEIFDKLLGNSK